jgi:serine/threonine protein kinase
LAAGTLAFNAPEQFNDSEFLPKPLDVWAFGISIYVYLTNNLPVSLEGNYEQNHNNANFEQIINELDAT